MPSQAIQSRKCSFRFQIMNHLRHNGGSPQEWDEILTPLIKQGFRQELTPGEVSLIEATGNIPSNRIAEYSALINKLDEFILHVASSLGWHIVLSTLVQFRMTQWEKQPEGPEKLRRLGAATGHAAVIFQRQRPARVTDLGWHQFRKELIEELKLLFQQLADIIRSRRNCVTLTELLELVSNQLNQHPEGFGLFRRNSDSFRDYLSYASDTELLS